jgi:hypothetical protein
MSVESIKLAMMMSKLAASEDEMDGPGPAAHIPAPPQAAKDHAINNTQVLSELFESKDGLAQNSKKDLGRYFDIKNPQYAMREQSLVEKVAHVIRK